MSALWCVSHFDQSQDGLKTSVVDVPVAVQIPSADRSHHFVNNLLSALTGMVTNIFLNCQVRKDFLFPLKFTLIIFHCYKAKVIKLS